MAGQNVVWQVHPLVGFRASCAPGQKPAACGGEIANDRMDPTAEAVVVVGTRRWD
jgi:hypothetical protein